MKKLKKLKKLTAIVTVCALSLTVAAAATKGKEDAYAADVSSGKAGTNTTWTLEDGVLTLGGTGTVGWDGWKETLQDSIADNDPTALDWRYNWHYNPDTGRYEQEKTEESYYNPWKSERVKSVKKVSVQDGITGFKGSVFNYFGNMKEAELADSVTDIGWAFWSCDNLEKITLPNKLIEIQYRAFAGCSSLPEITIPSSVVKIGDGAFSSCESLKDVKLSNNVTTVAYETFYNCSSLPEITIPYSVTSIEERAFDNCTSLATVNFEGDMPEFAYNAFNGVTATVYYPKENSTWTAEKQQNYGGNLTWVAKSLAESLAIVREGTDSEYAIGSGKSVSIQSTGPLKYLTGISVDGKALSQEYYSLDKDKNAVVISAQYLDSLSAGDHTITLNYTYGSVDTVLKVSGNSQTNIGANPKTADNSHAMVWMIVSLLSAGCFCVLAGKRRKKLD